MKKIVTLFLTLFILSTAVFPQQFAAVSFRTPAVNRSFGNRYAGAYSFTKYEHDRQVAYINAAYNQQVREAMRLRIPASRKIDLMQQLQRERNNKIYNVSNRFSNYRNTYNNRNFGWIR